MIDVMDDKASRRSQTEEEMMMGMVPSPNRGGGEGAESPLRWWLDFGMGTTPLVPNPTRRVSVASSISEDIRMNFADDRDLFSSDDLRTPHLQESVHPLESASLLMIEPSPSLSRGTSSVDITRRASQQRLKNLQREVDQALEFFHQETENELGSDSDGDEYLNGHEKFQENVVRRRIISNDSECNGNGHAPTSMATSVTTSMAASDDTNFDNEFDDCDFAKFVSQSETEAPTIISGDLSLKHRTKSFVSLPLSLLTSEAMDCSEDEGVDNGSNFTFESVSAEELNMNCSKKVDFNSGRSLSNAMEPSLAIARLQREEARQGVFTILDKMLSPGLHGNASQFAPLAFSSEQPHCIGSNYGVPYPELRNESSFLYDVDSFPLERVLAETLGVKVLSQIHVEHPLIKDKARLLTRLHNRGCRRKFHHLFDSFVTSHVIPLLHSQALSKGVFYTNRHQLQKGRPQRIIYRYQAFPSIDIVRPGESSTDPHCDMAHGHSIGNISFHIPLTSTFGTNAVYTESRPGREDWHPLVAKSPGLGFQFDGARCLHFHLRNESDITRVSLCFRIAITRALECCGDIVYDPNDQLCCSELLKDKFSRENPGFYDQVVVNVGHTLRSYLPGPLATKWKGDTIFVIG